MRLLVPDEYRIYKRVCYSLDRIIYLAQTNERAPYEITCTRQVENI